MGSGGQTKVLTLAQQVLQAWDTPRPFHAQSNACGPFSLIFYGLIQQLFIHSFAVTSSRHHWCSGKDSQSSCPLSVLMSPFPTGSASHMVHSRSHRQSRYLVPVFHKHNHVRRAELLSCIPHHQENGAQHTVGALITPKDQYVEKKKARLISNKAAAECRKGGDVSQRWEEGGVSLRCQLLIKACSLDVRDTQHHQTPQPLCGAGFQGSAFILLRG